MLSKLKYRIPHFLNRNVNGLENITVYGSSISMHYGCPTTTECSPYVLELPRGRFLLEVWGARGCKGMAGGYSKGILTLGPKSPEFSTFYVYVGSSGLENDGNGGFNGGGALTGAGWVNGQFSRRYVGGGATDIRTIKGEEEKLLSAEYYTTYFGPRDSLESRIIVAGGGSMSGIGVGEKGPNDCYGSQTSGGKTYNTYGVNGGFGYGGYSTSSGQGIAGGGGGYYGGGGQYGGSGFVNKNLLKNAELFSGDTEFPSPYTIKKEKGHMSDGCARITVLDMLPLCTRRYKNDKGYFMYYIILLISF